MKPWTADAWNIEGTKSLPPILRALSIIAPQDGRVYLEEPQDKAVRETLHPLSDPLPDVRIATGTLRVRENALFHIPSTPENLKVLVELAETHASPEVCMHLVLYTRDRILLEAYDVPAGGITINKSVARQHVQEFCNASGGKLVNTA